METEEPGKEILEKIKEKIKKETPHGRSYAKFVSALRITLLVLLVFISTLTLSIFLGDILQKLQGGEFENFSLLQNIVGFLFEFLVIAIFGVTAIYLVYRHTDWPFVKERLRLVLGSFLLIALLSIGLVILSENEKTALGAYLDGVKDKIEAVLPFKAWRDNDNPKDIRAFEGTIILIEKDGRDSIIEVESQSEKVRLMLEKKFGDFAVGDKVKLLYEIDGDQKDVEMIERI